MTLSVVVTGAGAGIGRAILERVLADGYAAVALEVDEARAAGLHQLTAAKGAVVVGDVSKRADLERAGSAAVALAPLGGWVNNAGLAIGGNLHKPVPAEVDRLFGVNLHGVYWGCAEAIKRFAAQKSQGVIVNISSIHGRSGFPGWAAYDAAKGAVDALTRYIAVEYGPVGIRANAIAPGAIATETVGRVVSEAPDPAAAEEEWKAFHPLQRLGQNSEVAAVASFLLSEESSFISGQSIAVDGGATARCFAYPPSEDLLRAFGRGVG